RSPRRAREDGRHDREGTDADSGRESRGEAVEPPARRGAQRRADRQDGREHAARGPRAERDAPREELPDADRGAEAKWHVARDRFTYVPVAHSQDARLDE